MILFMIYYDNFFKWPPQKCFLRAITHYTVLSKTSLSTGKLLITFFNTGGGLLSVL